MKYWLMLWMGLAACSGPTLTSTSSPPSPGLSTGANTSVLATPASDPLGLKIISPEDGAVVHMPQVEVAGEAPMELVITINDEIVLVGETGTFAVTIPLEEGPNAIQIVASDVEGNEVSFELIVTYEPES